MKAPTAHYEVGTRVANGGAATDGSRVEHREFLSPRCSVTTLDAFIPRTAILQALRGQLRHLNGTVLDVGCGQMPYKPLVMSPPSRANRYIGMDLEGNTYAKPDLEWDGRTIPLEPGTVDCALATEVFEHCPDVDRVMREIFRVLKPGGMIFFTVPFVWPLHDVPYDEYRYTPFSLERHLRNAGFDQPRLQALGGWDATLAQVIGLWVRRREMAPLKRAVLSRLALPVIRYLAGRDRIPESFTESAMITGITGTATKPL